MEGVYEFSGVLWEYPGEAPWVFITLAVEDADEIHARVREVLRRRQDLFRGERAAIFGQQRNQ